MVTPLRDTALPIILHSFQPFCLVFAFFPSLLFIFEMMLRTEFFMLCSPPRIPEGQLPKAWTLFIAVSPEPHSGAGIQEVLVNIYGKSKGAARNGVSLS